jgi:hypothetical protein
MSRRKALRKILYITGGVYLLSACDSNSDDIILSYENLNANETHKQLLASIVEVIIPAGKLKGAYDVGVHNFILLMVNDCFNEEDQGQFMLGLNEFKSYSKFHTGKVYEKLTRRQKEVLIQDGIDNIVKNKSNSPQEKAVQYFLKQCKQLTIQGFMNSEFIQHKVLSLSLIPGSYNGAVLISDTPKKRING